MRMVPGWSFLVLLFVIGMGTAFADEPEPFAEALPDSFEEHEQDPTIGDAVEQGSFVLPSVMKLESARMPVLVDIFPKYSPRNRTTAWGRGWESPMLSIRRVRVEGAPRFDAGDSFTSAWGRLQTRGSALFVRGFLAPVEGTIAGTTIVVLDQHGTEWTYDGTRYKGSRGIERWELITVNDVFGNRVALTYGDDGNLETARWTRQGLLAHQVVISYSVADSVAWSELVAGVDRASKRRVAKVVVSNTHRDTGALAPIATYTLQFEAPKREWLLTSISESRGGHVRKTSYQYGTPWFATNDRLAGRLVKSAASLPTFPAIPYPDHALASDALVALDVSDDGGSDVMMKDGTWWIFDRQQRQYIRSSFLDKPDADCVDPDAPWPTLLRFRNGYEDSFLVRLVSKKKNSLELTQCSLPGKLVARTRLTVPRPAPIAGCEAIKPGPIERQGRWPFSLADLDADGIPDLSVADACRLLVWYGRRDGDKLALASTADVIEVAGLDPAIKNVALDYNGDGLVDVIDYSKDHRVWLHRGNVRAGKPQFDVAKSLRAEQTEGRSAGTCLRYLLHVDTDRFLDAMTVCQLLDEVGAPPGMAPFRFAFFRGELDRFRQIRYFEDTRWVAGWPSTLAVSEHAGPGLTFTELLPTARASADKPCPEGSAKGATRGPSGPQYWCSPLVYWMPLAGPDADAMTSVDNGRGDRTTFTYAWSTFPPKFGRGPAVLASKTRHVIGRDSVTSEYRYEDPWFEERMHAFGGFRKITRTDQRGSTQHGAKKKTTTFTFEVLASIAVRRQTRVQGSDGSIRGRIWKHERTDRDGIPLVRLASTTTTLTLAGTTSQRTRTDLAYARSIDICPSTRTWSTLAGSKMSRSSKLAYERPRRASTLACLEARREVVAKHADPALDFVEQVRTGYTAHGQLARVAAVAGGTAITMRSTTYAGDGNPTTTAAGGSAPVRFTAYRELVAANGKHAPTALAGVIDLPDGRTIEIDYDPITDQPTVLRATRRDKTGKRIVRRVTRTADAWGRLVSEASDDGAGTASAWRTIEYRDATAHALAAQWTTNKSFGAAAAEQRMTVIDGQHQIIAEFLATGRAGTTTSWRIESALFDNDRRNEIVELAGGTVALDAGAVPTPWQMMSANSSVVRRRKRSPGSLEGEVIESPASGVELVWKTKAALDPSGLLVFTRTDGTRTEHERFDAANRLVSVTTPAGATRTTEYDARGRLRRLLLPGVVVKTDYDAWGRVSATSHGDLAVAYTYVANQPLVECEKTMGGALRLETCFTYNAIGQPIARRSTTNGILDDVVRWTYEPGFASPTAIEGFNYKTEIESDGVEGFGEGRSTRRTTVFPLPETAQNLPRHDPSQALTLVEATEHRADGSIAKSSTTLLRNGQKLLGGDVTCTDARDAFGALARWTCGAVSISKSTATRTTTYTMSNGRTLTVTHDNGRRRWDAMMSSQQGAHRWTLTRATGQDGWTGGESLAIAPAGRMTGYERFPDGALQAVDQAPATPSRIESYTYDPLGLVSSTLGQPIQRTAQTITLGGRTWRFDDLGRITSADGATLTWSAQNQVLRANRAGRTARYVHDAAGQRLLRAETANGATTWTFSRGRIQARMTTSSMAAQVRIPVELDGHIFAILTESGTRDVEYDAVNNLFAVDGKPSPGASFGHRATHLTDVPEYAGAYHDDLLGAFRFGVRDYQPELAQFTSPDPLVLRAPAITTDARSSNLYSYARANPHDYVDPSGLTECQTTEEGCQSGSTSASLDDDFDDLCREYGGCPPPIEVDERDLKWPWEEPHADDREDTEGGFEPPIARDDSDPYARGAAGVKPFVKWRAARLAVTALRDPLGGIEARFGFQVVLGAGLLAGVVTGLVAEVLVAAIEGAYEHQVNRVAANIHQVFMNPSTPPPGRR